MGDDVMLRCPNCKYEYREGLKKCSECGFDLVEDISHNIKEVTKKDNVNAEKITYGEEKFLISVRDDMEAKIIEAKLNAYDVPILKKYKGLGSYLSVYMGSTVFGIDIYVPENLYEKSIDLIGEDVE
jgi:hypothetical protein